MKVRRWAIRTGEPHGFHGFIGYGWFRERLAEAGGPHLVPVVLFLTRREARAALARVKGPRERGRFPRAAVVRVTVSVEAEP